MKFLADAHLPPGLCDLLRAAGHDVIHTLDLPARNATTDTASNQGHDRRTARADHERQRFYHSHLLHQRPEKLLLVRTGNISTGDLKRLFAQHLPEIVAAFDHNSLIELERQRIRVIA